MKAASFCVGLLLIALAAVPATAQQYTDLLRDRNLSQWMLEDGRDVQSGWTVETDGSLHLAGRGGNLLSKEEFGDFDLWFEWRISERGNSGIKYRVTKYGKSWLGPEYQIQDDAAFPKMSAEHYTASLYDLVDKSLPIFSRRYLDLNTYSVGRVIVQRHRIRHWMNGNLVIDERDDSERFAAAVKDSKFRGQDGFGRNHRGHLMLTDHGSEVWYRNVFIRRLDNCAVIP
ncbi:MAG: hypothetical protein RLZZ436_1954 [Planctomycetota bacterium]|jgi:hypothetical protein